MLQMDVQLGERSYPIYFGKDALRETAGRIAAACPNGRASVISDENVWMLHGASLKDSLLAHGVTVTSIVVPPGESSKSLDTLSHIYSELYAAGFKRSDPMIAFGGGVVGDLAGFAAATYMRSVPFIQIPTTLLAQVDASVGGKVAVNLREGKNLVGSFYQPIMVVADTDVLSTLPKREWKSGMAEVVKYACIGESELASLLKTRVTMEILEHVIYLCCKSKVRYVEHDEHDTGERMMLNFGHTFGHAIEKYYDFSRYNHGEAVTIGMALAAHAGETLNVSAPGTREHVLALLDAQELDYANDAEISALIDLMRGDKKNSDENISLVLLKKMGEPVVHKISVEDLKRVFAKLKVESGKWKIEDAKRTGSQARPKGGAEGELTSPKAIRLYSKKGSQKSQGVFGERLVQKFPNGIIEVPPSKSILHRAIICSGLAGGGEIRNMSHSKDIEATIRCMDALNNGGDTLDCGESGTTLRLLIPIAAALGKSVTFTGQGRLMQRPLAPYIDALRPHGVEISQASDEQHVSGTLKGGPFQIAGDISSQFISGLLLALPLTGVASEILITTELQSDPYVRLTLDMMERFGVRVENENYRRFYIEGGQKYIPADVTVEGDYSQAAFFLVAGALGCPCECHGLSEYECSHQGDARILDIIEDSGGIVERVPDGWTVFPWKLKAQTVDVSNIPDLVPPIAALFAFCKGQSVIEGAARLRYKESDRLQTVMDALNALGADVTIDGDSLVINGQPSIRGGHADSFGDHRIAMMCAVAAIRAENPVYIRGSECVDKSYPDFWQDFCVR